MGTVAAHLRRQRADDYIAVHSDVLMRIPRRSTETFQNILRAYAREPDEEEMQAHRPLVMRLRDRIRIRTRIRAVLERLRRESGGEVSRTTRPPGPSDRR
jgi:hypothetical protein